MKGSRSMMYLAHPTRIWKEYGSDRIIQFARKKGFAPVNPFNCGDFQDFEGGLVGREETLDWTLYLQRGCYWSGYFGISEGVMRELQDRLKWDKEKRMRVFYEDDQGKPFDDKWEQEYGVLKNKYGDLLAELRGPHKLIPVTAQRAVGKTYWIDRLIKIKGLNLRRIKNTTTRAPRDKEDENSYNFVSKEEFLNKVDNYEFLEYVEDDEGNLYGSSLAEIKKVLQSQNGIFAITPEGAAKLYRCRFEINVAFLNLKASRDAHLKNLRERGIMDPKLQEYYIANSEKFILPSVIPHRVLELTRTKSDEVRVLDAIGSLLK